MLESTSLIDSLARSLAASSFKARSQAVQILAGICVLSADEGHLLVMKALSRIGNSNPVRRFKGLMDSFGTSFGDSSDGEREMVDQEDLGVVWDYRTSAMGLCNVLVNCAGEVEERVGWRDTLRGDGLTEVILVLFFSSFTSLDLDRQAR